MINQSRLEAKIEAVAQADAYMNNVGLATYTELLEMLQRIHKLADAPVNQNIAGKRIADITRLTLEML